MSVLWLPDVVKKPLPINPSRDPRIDPTPGDIFHIAVSEADSLFDFFKGRTDGIESTGYIRRDGTLEQYRPLDVECDANGDGNSFTFDGHRGGFNSWETQGGEFGEWSDAQVATIQRIILHKHEHFGTPLRLAPAWNRSGFGYHRLHHEWNRNGHTCPGPDRVRQFNRVIVPWMDRGGHTEEDDMTPGQAKLLEAAAADAKAGRAAAERAEDNARRALLRGQVNSRLGLSILAGDTSNTGEILSAIDELDKADEEAHS